MQSSSHSAKATRKLRPATGEPSTLSKEDVFTEVSRLIEEANAQVKLAPNAHGVAKLTVEGSRLELELYSWQDEFHVSIFAKGEVIDHIVQSESFDFNVEIIDSGREAKRFSLYPGWGAAAVFEGFPIEQWVGVQLRLTRT